MALNPTSKSNVEITANNTGNTYITPTFAMANANIANGSTFRITVSGQKIANSNSSINNTYESADMFNIHWGANNNPTDNIMYTVTYPIKNPLQSGGLGGTTVEGNPYVYKQFLVTLVNYSITTGFANLWLTLENSGTYGNIAAGNIALSGKPTGNANSNAGITFLGVSYQALTSQPCNVYFDTCLVEQVC